MEKSLIGLPIVLVSDPGLDDLYLLQYFLRRGWTVAGIVLSFGCNTLAHSLRNVSGFLDLCGQNDIPLILGPEDPLNGIYDRSLSFGGDDGTMNLGFTRSRAALDGVAPFASLLDAAGKSVLICSSPATPIARLHRHDRHLIPRHVAEIYAMGGAVFGPGNCGLVTPDAPRGVAEHNVAHDPEAWDDLLRIEGPPIHLITWDEAGAIAIPEAALLGRRSTTPPGAALLRGTQTFFSLYGSDLAAGHERSFAPLDLLLGLAFDGIGRYTPRRVKVVLHGDERGRTIFDDSGSEDGSPLQEQKSRKNARRPFRTCGEVW